MSDAFKCDGCGEFHDGRPAVRMNTEATLPGTGAGGMFGPPDAQAGNANEYCSQGCALEDNLGEQARETIEDAFERAAESDGDPTEEIAEMLGMNDDTDDGDTAEKGYD